MSIHDQILEVTVVGCNKLRDTEWISRQDPYVCLEYGSAKFRTRTCTDGGKNPTFQEKFSFRLIEGLREICVAVYNSNSLSYDDFIGSGKILLNKVLSQGYDDTPWTILSKRGRSAGEVAVILHFPNAHRPSGTSAPHYAGAPTHYTGAPPPYAGAPPPYFGAPPPQYHAAPPPPPAGYPYSAAPTFPSYQPPPSVYPPSGSVYPPPPGPYSTYPPPPY